MIMPYFLWRKQKVYRLVCNRNIESGCDKISNGGGGGLWNWRWQSIHDDTVSNYLFAQLCRTVVGEWEGGEGRGDKRNWLVQIQQDVIFLSQNFISTSCIANLTWFLAKKKLLPNLINQFYLTDFLAQSSPRRLFTKEGRLFEDGRLI